MLAREAAAAQPVMQPTRGGLSGRSEADAVDGRANEQQFLTPCDPTWVECEHGATDARRRTEGNKDQSHSVPAQKATHGDDMLRHARAVFGVGAAFRAADTLRSRDRTASAAAKSV